MFTAFQPNAFQSSAYQIVNSAVSPVKIEGGGKANSYYDSRHDYYLKQHDKIKAEKLKAEESLALKEVEIEALELKRLQARKLSDQNMQRQLIALMIEARQLQEERAALEQSIRRYMIEQEDIIFIIMCLPFC